MSQKKQKAKTAEALNRDYFQSLIATRSSLGMLGISWAGVLVGMFLTTVMWGTGLDMGWNPPYNIVNILFILSTAYMLLSQLVVLIEPIRHYFYQHQRFSSIWQLLFVLTFSFQLTSVSGGMVIVDNGRVDVYGSSRSLPLLIASSLFYLLAIVYNEKVN